MYSFKYSILIIFQYTVGVKYTMKPIIVDFSDSSSDSLYVQLYKKIRDGILSGEISEGERLPSLRSLSSDLNVSITTSQMAYNQLLVEGLSLIHISEPTRH